MKAQLSEEEQDTLIRLGENIQANLSCDTNGTGLPCRTDRLEAVSGMKKYLKIHGYSVIPPYPDYERR
jgi:hypothetical protein